MPAANVILNCRNKSAFVVTFVILPPKEFLPAGTFAPVPLPICWLIAAVELAAPLPISIIGRTVLSVPAEAGVVALV